MKRDIYRPLRIVHGSFGYAADAPYEEKCRCVRRRIEELQAKGYGGIVTNVAAQHYLDDPEEWQLMAEKARVCQQLGMRMWLYDEDGYPSGAAGVHTLAEDPDFEARAAVMVSLVLPVGQCADIPLPHGHEKLLAAVCYPMAGAAPTDEELLPPHARPSGLPVHFVNDTAAPLLCLAFFQKRMYEGAHAQHNVFCSRRYIDVSNRDAVAAFIKNTYCRYTQAVGGFYAKGVGDDAPNAVIEAIFTDEPSYMGAYINAGLYPPQVAHPYDDSIPLYPVVNWGRDVAARFAATYGYRLEEELTALFLGHGPHFCRVRQDYHQLMSDLYEQAFFAGLGDYCAGVGLNFSGHLLLEDELPLHVIFEGNFFSLLRHMHIPGIDMLQSTPETVWNFAFTPRLVRSVAELYGRPHVMDEVSAHAQGGRVSEAERTTALLLQLAFGADVFTSYYSDDDPDGSMRRTLDTLARAGQAIAGDRLSDTLLVYPIQTMMRHRRPAADVCEVDSDSGARLQGCADAAMQAQYALLNGQKSFTWADAEAVSAQTRRPCRPWRSLVIPACDITPQLASAARAAAEAGWQLLWYCPPAAQALFGAGSDQLPAGTQTVTTPAALLAALRPAGPQLLACGAAADEGAPKAAQGAEANADGGRTGEADGAASMATDGAKAPANTDGIACAETEHCVLLVNRDSVARPLCWRGAVTGITDPASGQAAAFTRDAQGVCFTLPAGGALLLHRG